MLEIEPATGKFARHESHPLECDLLVVDETSMVDVVLMHALLRALPERAGLLLVGDVDQLPSVGPGRVLGDLLESGVVPTVRLREIFRQAANICIVTSAHRIRQGQMPELRATDAKSDFYFLERNTPEEIVATLLRLVQEQILQRRGLDPIRDIQVLSPMNKGATGVRDLNILLQRARISALALLPGNSRLWSGLRVYRAASSQLPKPSRPSMNLSSECARDRSSSSP